MHPSARPRPVTTGGPFTTAQFVESGHDRSLLRRREYQQVFRSAWVHVDDMDELTRIRAALLLHPEGAVASHFSAARVYRLPVPEHPFEHVLVFRAKDRRRRDGLKSHVTIRLKRIRRVRGVAVVEPVTMFIQLAAYLSLVDLVVLGDAIVREFGITPEKLVKLCRRSGDQHAGAAAVGAAFVRVGVDSPAETILRMLIVLAGLPEPTTNVQLHDESGALRRRFDLYYRAGRVIVEYDGRQHAEDVRQWRRDLHRREELDDEHYRILVVTAEGIYRKPEETLLRVRRVLLERGVAHVPPINDTWRDYFPAWQRRAR
ncbi:DUF559 domain-containing protein [Nocardioides pyridinolyticus]